MKANSQKTGVNKHPNKVGHEKFSRVLIVTGLSGSGKTVALRAVEDAGYFCVDNLPVTLINSLLNKTSNQAGISKIAIGIDIREKGFLSDIDNVINNLRANHNIEILFLEADNDVIIRRFKETRRPHPLGGRLEDAVIAERKALSSLREKSDRVIDTSSLSPHQLRRLITSLYLIQESRKQISISLISFGFKYGVPQNIDLLFDVRFLPNPFFIPVLKDLTGLDSRVSDYIFKQPETKKFMKKIKDLLEFLIPLYIKEGKTYLSIAIGCTGGNHRSPAIVERIAQFLKKDNIDLNVIHRDMS